MKRARTPEQMRRTSYRMLAAFAVFSVLAAFSPGSKLLIVLFPLMSLGIAIYVMERLPGVYVSFTCWLFFLSPLVRRLVEYHIGSASASFLLTAPQIVPIVGLYVFRHRWSELFERRYRPWILASAVILYGILLGFALHGVAEVLPEMLGWLSPVCFSLYLVKQREHLEEMIHSFRSSFLAGTAVMGLYGIYQYFYLAPWDAFWMAQNPFLTSIGLPRAQEVRVFSTMNTPQPLADNLLVGIFFAFVARRPVRLLTVAAGLIALALSLARSAWLAGAIALLFLAFELTPRQRLRLVMPAIVCGLALATVVVLPQLQRTLSQRLHSFANPGQDQSVNERITTQAEVTSLFLANPFGLGVGANASAQSSSGPSFGVIKPGFNLSDNGIQQLTLTFGWFGTLVFAAGLGEGLLLAFRSGKHTDLLVLKATLVCTMVEMPVLGIFLGITGVLLWAAIAFCIASHWVHFERQASTAPPLLGYAGTVGVVP